MTDHPDDVLLRAYVMDELDALQTERLERHVLGCPPCLAKLQAEARVEIAMGEVAAAAPAPRKTPVAWAVGALAAVLVGWVVVAGAPSQPQVAKLDACATDDRARSALHCPPPVYEALTPGLSVGLGGEP